MKRMVMALGLLIGSFAMANAQVLVENFEYTDGVKLETTGNWNIHSGTLGGPTVDPTMLTFTGYAYSGFSKSALLDTNGIDINRTFAPQSAGSVYASFMVNVTNVVAGYFLHFGGDPMGTTFRGKVFIGGTNSGMSFGATVGSNTSTLATSTATDVVYSINTTYLIVLKYEIVEGGTNDNKVSLFVFDSTIPGTEPVTPTIGPLTDATMSEITPASIGLRQFNVGQNMKIGGIRVGTSWAETGLPVELSSFTISASGKSALLKWETTTEKNNAGFEVLRNGESVGFVSGKGTTTEKQTYTFTDKNVGGHASYQLKQVDTDGKTSFSQILSFNGTPSSFEVAGNYPNPFNPATTIKFTLPEVSNVVVKVHNIIGQEIATLVNGKMNSGVQEVRFDASNLSSGVYFYSVSANGKTFTKSMTLMK